MKEQKLNLWTKLGYGMGDIYGGGVTTIISMYYLFYLTDVLRIRPGLAGTAILISKLWDAVTDPFMGVITDNTRTKLGRRRPYFLAGIILIFVSFFLMWMPVGFTTQSDKFTYVLLTYLFFSTVYTLVWVPYTSLAPELTDSYNERTKLSTYRMLFSNISGILAGVLAKDIFVDSLYPDSPQTGFMVMGLVFGLFFALPYILVFFTCKERKDYSNIPKRKIGRLKSFIAQYFIQPFHLKPFRNVSVMYLMGFMAQDAVMALAVYFLTYYLGIPSMMTLLVPVYVSMLLAIPFIGMISNKVGKNKTFIGAAVLWIISFLLVFFMTKDSMIVIYIFGVLFGISAGGIQVQVFAIFADIPDADQLYSGQRREGTYSGLFAFLRKAGSALIMFLIGNSIEWVGYIPPQEEMVDGVLRLVNQTQTAEFLTALLLIFIFVPVLFIVAAIIAAIKYPITQPVFERLKKANAYDKDHLSEAQAQEIDEIKRMIGGGGHVM